MKKLLLGFIFAGFVFASVGVVDDPTAGSKEGSNWDVSSDNSGASIDLQKQNTDSPTLGSDASSSQEFGANKVPNESISVSADIKTKDNPDVGSASDDSDRE